MRPARWLVLLVVGAALADAQAQPERRGRRGGRQRPAASQPASDQATQPASTAHSAPATTTTVAAKAEKDRYLAVVGGRVYTASGPVIDGATVLCRNDRIVQIGRDVALPADTEVIDAAGMYVYPGLIAVASAGIHGAESPEDETNVFGLGMTMGLAGGITTAAVGNTAAKLTFGRVEGMIVKRNLYVALEYTTRRPAQRAELRSDLERVRGYLRDLSESERRKETDKDAKPPDAAWIKGKYENYLKLLKREAIASISAGTIHEVLDACELAQAFGLRMVIRGAHEAWIRPGALGRAGAGAVVTPRTRVDPDERLMRDSGSTIENAAILHEHGATVAIVPAQTTVSTGGLAGRDLLQLNLEAAFAVRGGLSDDAALRAITIDAARVLGIDDRVGSLEVGKDADLIVADGDILSYLTHVRYAIVNGRVAYDMAQDPYYGHIRRTGPDGVPQFDDNWPRRLAWPDGR